MSSYAVVAVRECRGVSIAERAVLFTMADQADDSGYVWLGLERIAEELEVHVRTIQRAVNGQTKDEPGLIGRGYLEVVYEGGGRSRPTLFRMLPALLTIRETERGLRSLHNYQTRFGSELDRRSRDKLPPFRKGKTPAPPTGNPGARDEKPRRPRHPTLNDTEGHAAPAPPRLDGETVAAWLERSWRERQEEEATK